MKFTKMHGIGNDYVYVNGFAEQVENPSKVAELVADRHFGIGGDGLILILPSQTADVRMQMFNADGSEGEMCGNGIRCVAKYAYEHGLAQANPLRVETLRGVLPIQLTLDGDRVQQATVDMEEPILNLPDVPVDASKIEPTGRPHTYRIALPKAGTAYDALFVSMGNPHAVMFVDDVAAIDLDREGPEAEHHPAFPRRINAHWVQVHSPTELTMRTWERGSGITLACGTGASAVGVAGVLAGLTERTVLIHLPGGDLTIEWREADNHVYMTGSATEVFTGEWSPA
ncbi:MAG: diaminopimelate epimerase [Chloroflexi bacterium]|nr:diaminopimelate epimerase [Chloroflexota bacterium]